MVGKFESRVGHQLLCALRVCAHPLAAHEERCGNILITQVVDDFAIVARNFMQLLAEVQRQGDPLFVLRKRDTPDNTT